MYAQPIEYKYTTVYTNPGPRVPDTQTALNDTYHIFLS